MTEAVTEKKLEFQAEIKQLMKLVTHALYSNSEIFLRELISNASDALDKLRYEALSQENLYEGQTDLTIKILVNRAEGTVSIIDNGIGMTADEAVQHLGTIAKSGTRELLERLSETDKKNSNLIGQFGVGFYSAFTVADAVTVQTRKAGVAPEQGVIWRSNGEGEFSITPATLDAHGTSVTLHLKPESREFLDEFRLRHLIVKYSDHILWPILMNKTQGDDLEEKVEPNTLETINQATALWTLPKSQIKEEEYQQLYQHIAHDFEKPLCYTHNKVEGAQEYTLLLYLPSRAPFDLFQANKVKGLKLYVRRVFIMDDAEQFLPNYLRFVRGIIDSNDLPLNVSREMLQSSRVVDSIRSSVVKRVLDMLDDLAEHKLSDYATFWKEFGTVLKEGPIEDFSNRERIGKLLRFSSTFNNTAEQTVSFADYIARMKPNQDKIYYCVADTFQAAQHSPHLEVFRKHGIEVLLLSDRVDEWLMAHLQEYQDKKLQSVARGDVDLSQWATDAPASIDEATKTHFQPILEQVKSTLSEWVEDVRLTERLTESPSCIVVSEQNLSPHMQRILSAAGQQVPHSKPILELNPTHPLVKRLETEQNPDLKNDLAVVLYGQAVLSEGGALENPVLFVKKLNSLLRD